MTPAEAWDSLRNRATESQRYRLDRAVAELLSALRAALPPTLPFTPAEGDTVHDRSAQTMWLYDGTDWHVMDGDAA